MKILRAIFRKEWTEAKRDPRAWLLTLVVPVLFYPAALWIAAGDVGRGPLRVAVDDPWLAQRIAALPGFAVVAPGAPAAHAEVIVLARDPGFPEAGALRVGVAKARGSLLAGQAVDRALADISRQLAAGRAARAGLDAADLDPVTSWRPPDAAGRDPVGRWKPSDAAAATGEPASLLAYLLVFVMFTGCLATAVDSGAGERERGGMEALLATPAPALAIAGGKVLFIMVTGVASVVSSLAGLAAAALVAGGAPGLTGMAAAPLLATAALLLSCAGLIASWLFACSLGARSAREAHAWISGLFLLVSLGLIWATFGATQRAGAVEWLPLFGATRAIGALLDADAAARAWLAPLLANLAGWALGLAFCARLLRRESALRAW